MKMFLSLLLCSIYSLVLAQDPIAPGLEFVCELHVTVGAPMTVGETQHGLRRMVPITGGHFEGPAIKGVVLNGGADYQYVNEDKTRSEIEAIYNLETDDGVIIHIRNEGLSIKTKAQLEARKKGEYVDWTKAYFRAAPKFDAPKDSKYAWMNDALFICKGISSGGKGYVTIQVWKVL